MPENETPDTQPTMQQVAEKLDKGAEALNVAQEQLHGDVAQAMAKLSAHENDPTAHNGAVGGGASEAQVAAALAAHNSDPLAHGLDQPDSAMYQMIATAASNAVEDKIGSEDGQINFVAHASKHGKNGADPITPASIGAVADDDERLTDARTPKAHQHTLEDITGFTLGEGGEGGEGGDADSASLSIPEYVGQKVEAAISEHDASDSAHAALFENILVGNTSPIIGICRVATGGGAGLWFNVDESGNPVSPNTAYFDNNPVFGGIQRMIVDEQIMGKIPQFWVKDFTPTEGMFAGKPCKLISPGQKEGFRIHPAFMNNNAQIPYYLLGCFEATDEGGNPKKLGSRPGKKPFTNVNFDTMKTYCANRNVNGVSGFMLWDVYQWSALAMLMLTELATTDAQAILGRGNVDKTWDGKTDNSVNTDSQENHVPYRGFHAIYGNVWKMLDGVRADANKKTEIFKNDGTRAWIPTGYAMPPYTSGLTGWPVSMRTGYGDGYNFDDVFLPEIVTGTEGAATYADGFWGPVANGVCYQGGGWSYGSIAGPFCLYFHGPSSSAGINIGGRLAKI